MTGRLGLLGLGLVAGVLVGVAVAARGERAGAYWARRAAQDPWSWRPLEGKESERRVTPGRFVVTKNSKGQYHFVLKAGNGETIAQSEMYTSKSAAMNGIASVTKNAATAKVDDQASD